MLDPNSNIQKSESEYSSPIVVIKKKTNCFRLCVDYRTLNKLTLRDNFAIPSIEDQIDQLRGNKYFTTPDLKSAYHHVDMDGESVKFTSFITSFGQFEFLKMPFGLKNSLSVFMRYIRMIFNASNLLESNKILIYLDDICILTNTFEEHLVILKEVFYLLVRNCLTLRLDKCSFCKLEINYLGYVINGSTIRPNDNHLMAIKGYPVPRNIKQLHSFNGLASYFRKFVHNFSLKAAALVSWNVLKI